MTKYEVQMDTLCCGWVNTWMVIENEKEEPETFDTYADAEAALDEYLEYIKEEIDMGVRDRDCGYDREDFRIVPVIPKMKGI